MRKYMIIAGVGGAAIVVALLLLRASPPSPQVEYRNPFSSPHQLIDGIYRADHHALTGSALPVRGVIVPHHLVASESVALGIRALKEHPPARIVLLSPDHYAQCPTLFCTVNGLFETEFGDVSAYRATIDALMQSPLVSIEPTLFKEEHGIYSILPFIAHYLPGVEVTPVVLSQHQLWKTHRDELLKVLRPLIDDHTVLVVSSDFSHYLPLAESDSMDALTQRALEQNDLPAIAALHNADQSDCPGCLWLMASIMQSNPEILMHTNAARILGDETVQETTSHYSILYR